MIAVCGRARKLRTNRFRGVVLTVFLVIFQDLSPKTSFKSVRCARRRSDRMSRPKSFRFDGAADQQLSCSACPVLAVRPEGANHQWRKIPPGELSIDPVADERLVRVTARAGAS